MILLDQHHRGRSKEDYIYNTMGLLLMLLGLTNTPSTFQQFMNHVFQPYFGKSIRVYIDDFCIYNSRVLHLVRVDEGLSRLAQMGGQLNMAKCHIGET